MLLKGARHKPSAGAMRGLIMSGHLPEEEARPTLGMALRQGARQLGGAETPMLDARLLLCEAAGLDHAGLIASEDEPVQDEALSRFRQMIAERAAGMPVSQLLGRREFYGRDFIVTKDVLTPRPETEMLIDAGLRALPEGGSVLDAGTGSGCLLLTMLAERWDAEGAGFDRSAAALEVARRNAAALRVGARATLIEASFEDFGGEGFDLVLCNPPYIEEAAALPVEVAGHEPALALYAGPDGLSAYRVLAARMKGWMAAEGSAFLEIGTGQGDAVSALFAPAFAGSHDIAVTRDLGGRERMVSIRPR
jgi:release factor glutamine methyltransferase